jgi:hypothetical protein
MEKLASVIYPEQIPLERRREMERIARGEGKRLRGPNNLSDEARKHVSPLGGVAKGWDKPRSK